MDPNAMTIERWVAFAAKILRDEGKQYAGALIEELMREYGLHRDMAEYIVSQAIYHS